MPEPISSELQAAYLQTNYVIDDENVRLTLRIGEKNSALDRLLENYKAQSCAFVTAYNPYSKLLSETENKTRQEKLLAELRAANYRYFHGYGASKSGDWQPEISVLVIGIDYQTAVRLARRHEQNAIVYAEQNSAPVLVWCD